MSKIRWDSEERNQLLVYCMKEFETHPYLSTKEIIEQAQLSVLPENRRRKFVGAHNYKWIVEAREKYVKERDKEKIPYVHIKDRPIFVEELPPKPDLLAMMTDLLADTIVKIVNEAIAKARERIDLPVLDIPATQQTTDKYKKIAIYGLFSNQEKEVRRAVGGCFELRFLKDVSQAKLISAVQWADHFVLMTKFISHDYEAIKKYKNLLYCNGGVSSLISMLENIYFEETTKPSV